MARNKVQFQRGLSDVEFERLYGSEEKCRAALFSWRWPEGFECPVCGGSAHCELKRALWQCNACRTQTSLTAGTIFAATKLDLAVWFRAMFHMTQTKQGISALELSRRIDVSYNTAWAMHHKLRQVMLERNQDQLLDGRIEMDDAYLGGERSGGKRGRGSPGKTPFVAAVETTQDGKAHRVKLRRVRRFTKKNIKKVTGRIVQRGARVVTDGLGCFNGVADAGCMHEAIVTGSGRRAARHPAFKAVNTVLGNIKCAIAATFRSGSRKHAPRRLAEFEYRFNRRYDLPAMIPRLGWVAARTPPMPYHLLKLAEDHGYSGSYLSQDLPCRGTSFRETDTRVGADYCSTSATSWAVHDDEGLRPAVRDSASKSLECVPMRHLTPARNRKVGDPSVREARVRHAKVPHCSVSRQGAIYK